MTYDPAAAAREMLPCPFCGGDAVFGEINSHGEDTEDAGGHFIQCTNAACGASIALIFPCMDDPKPQLLERWNTRAPAAGRTERSEPGDAADKLRHIARIIEQVDNRCMAVDGPVAATLTEMTQAEISEIYALAVGVDHAARPQPAAADVEAVRLLGAVIIGLDNGILDRPAIDAARALLACIKEDAPEQSRVATLTEERRVRHKKRGTTYVVVGTAELQMATDLVDGAFLIIYKGDDGKLWARQEDEFEDGRFEDVSGRLAAPVPTHRTTLPDATHDPYGHVKCYAFPPGCDTIEACKAANECAKAHPSRVVGYQPAAAPTQGHPGHGASMDGVAVATLADVPAGERDAVRAILSDWLSLALGHPRRSAIKSFLACLAAAEVRTPTREGGDG
jgi:hypothetical protein